MNIKNFRYVHFTGVKGVGMTSLALCLQDLGIQISGSDTPEIFVTDEVLAKRKIGWNVGFGEKNLEPRPDLVITTGAHGGLNNPEVIAAQAMGIPVLTHAEALGKTTTSSMLATLMDEAGTHPSFAIGVGNIFPLGVPGRYEPKGKYFVCEADEFVISPEVDNRPRFSYLSPKILVVTNIEHDHPDVYPTLEDTLRVFKDFFIKIPKSGLLVACVDNPRVKKAVGGLDVPVLTYGQDSKADWQVRDIFFKNGKTTFSLQNKGERALSLSINVPGVYNVLNATAAFIVGKFIGIDEGFLKKGLKKYKGCRRRFEKIGEVRGVTIYDDYAHHPKEILAVLAATKEWFPKRRLVAIFQPHTYSRTKALFNDFAQSFSSADVVAFMDIYASAREKPDREINSKRLAEQTKKYQSRVFYTGGASETLSWIKKKVRAGDILITLGAGDIFHLHKNLLKNQDGQV